MGFSVSGSAAIIFAAMFIGFGMFHSATTNGFEEINDAQDDRMDRTLVQQNTEIAVTSATYDADADGGTLTVEVENTGASQLSLADVDLLGDNEYLVPDATDVDGDEGTRLWLPGERLTLTCTQVDDPGQVKVVTGPAVADTESTEEVV